MSLNKLKTAILGAGTIVPDFLLSSTFVENVEAYCILGVESDREKMETFVNEYGLKHIYTDYEELLANDEIDVVYVALPNNLHFEYAKKALNCGKNVIVEKPFCSSSSQAEELFDIAEKNKKYVFEAIPNIHFPNFKEIKKQVGDVGDIKIVELNVSKYSRRYDDFKNGVILPAFDPKKDGGALMDMGVYNIHFLVGLFGEPNSVEYFPNIEKNIDTSGILILKYPHFTVSAIASKDCSSPSCINIQGDKGYIHSDSTTHILQGFETKQNDSEKKFIDLNIRAPHERLTYEIEEFGRIIADRDDARYEELKKQTLDVLKIITLAKEKIYE